MASKTFLKNITIPQPCNADWDSMIGNDQVRFCKHCNLDVHNLSSLTRSQAERLVARSNGRLCIRYYRDPLGVPLTQPVKQKLHHIGRRVSRIAAGAFTATLSVSSAIAQQSSGAPPQDDNVVAITKQLQSFTFGQGVAGVVKDQNGAVIPGAIVSLGNESIIGVLQASTDLEGKFGITHLRPGSYRIRIEAPGFSSYQSVVEVTQDGEARVDCILEVATIEETVEIEGSRVFTAGAMTVIEPDDPFIRAAQDDDLDTMAALIAGRDVNRRDEVSKTTALEHAVRNANREMVQLLLLAGAKVDTTNSSGETVLMMIDGDATADLVWDLINAGADVNHKDNQGNTPLMNAASTDSLEALKVLIEAGAKLNIQNALGQSALMQAASEGHVNAVRALVLAGADLNAQDKDGLNALNLAINENSQKVIRFLKSKGLAEVAVSVSKEEIR